MFCKKCGKEIQNESKFCPFCGIGVASDNSSKKEEATTEKQNIWDVFAKIYDSKGVEKEKYNELSSIEVWELINRLGKNTFESFIEENKEQLNKQPYKVIENFENMFKFAVIGGYWLWTAGYILKKGNNWKLKTIILDDIIKDWTENLKGLDDFVKNAPQDLSEAIIRYRDFKINDFLENSSSIKELPIEFIDKIKSEILGKILWGYFIGVTESKYIK